MLITADVIFVNYKQTGFLSSSDGNEDVPSQHIPKEKNYPGPPIVPSTYRTRSFQRVEPKTLSYFWHVSRDICAAKVLMELVRVS